MKLNISTIFKTFEHDVDGAINKIGIFGRAFGTIIDTIHKRQSDINKIFDTNGGDLNSAKQQAGNLWSYVFPSKIVTPEILGNFEAFKDLFNDSKLSAEALAEDLGGVAQRIVDYASTCKNGALTTKGFTQALGNMTLGAKAADIAMKALSIAGNMLAMIAIAKGIELAAKAIDNYVRRVEKAREALEESQSTYNSITKEGKIKKHPIKFIK